MRRLGELPGMRPLEYLWKVTVISIPFLLATGLIDTEPLGTVLSPLVRLVMGGFIGASAGLFVLYRWDK
jgi:hypothetical protein